MQEMDLDYEADNGASIAQKEMGTYYLKPLNFTVKVGWAQVKVLYGRETRHPMKVICKKAKIMSKI